MSGRRRVTTQVTNALGTRDLVWFGTRCDDIESIADLPNLTAAYSVIGAYRSRSHLRSQSLEELTGHRVDLDAHDIDEAPRDEHVMELRRSVLRSLATPSALFTYRPSTMISSVSFARRDRTLSLGMFKDHQSAFEHKPWVESQVAQLGVPHIPWTYVTDEEQKDTLRLLDHGPVMLRRSRTSGGTGLALVDGPEALEGAWFKDDELLVSVAPYIDDALPLNIGGVVWDDGVTLHLPSVQLIGIPECTGRPFGYCGNDFAAVKALDAQTIDTVEVATRTIGTWLGSMGYRGAFGVDFLVKDGVALFTEVNARFQGSTHLTSRISLEMDESCIVLDHLAAHLGLPAPGQPLLRSRLATAPDYSHLVTHSLSDRRLPLSSAPLVRQLSGVVGYTRSDVVAPSDLSLDPGATIARATFARSITTTGFDLAGDVAVAVRAAASEAGADAETSAQSSHDRGGHP